LDARSHPERIGPYTVVEVIGEGGMGVVYAATQSEPVQRTVALKVLRAEHSSPEVLARFQAERQALAVMDHPSVAKIFDAGITADGQSWFAMERVEGLTLVDFCDQNRMSVRARVRLFIEVCRAVQHAHQKGLIHRDLKPSNVLVSQVDGRPRPHIIDFGIAKAVEGEAFEGAGLTRDDQVLGTPAYMSPEQIAGSQDIDTRSDIYSMGVLLYQVLAGVLPYQGNAYGGWAALAAALHRDPPTPSRRLTQLDVDTGSRSADARGVSILELRKQLSGDLDYIVSRAMEKDPAARYETANGLALELERYLNHEPVRARAASRAYVLRKFVRRNRLGVAFGGTVAAGLLAFAVTTAVQSARVSAARDVAEARRSQAETLIDFMLGDLRQKLEPLGRLDVLDEVGEQAVRYFATLPEEEFTDEELANRSQALYQIGTVRLQEGRSGEAADAFAESLRLARELSARAPDDADRLFGMSQSHFWVGYAHWLSGDLTGAEAELQSYMEISRRLVALEPDNPSYQMELGYAHSNLGSVREARGELAGAQEAFELALDVEERLLRETPGNIDWLGEVAESHNKLAVILRKRGYYREALERHRRELALKGQLLEREPARAYWRERFGTALGFTGDLAVSTGDLEEALSLYGERMRLADSLSAYDPANAEWRRATAVAAIDVGRLRTLVGEPETALPFLDDAERTLRELLTMDSTGPRRHLGAALRDPPRNGQHPCSHGGGARRPGPRPRRGRRREAGPHQGLGAADAGVRTRLRRGLGPGEGAVGRSPGVARTDPDRLGRERGRAPRRRAPSSPGPPGGRRAGPSAPRRRIPGTPLCAAGSRAWRRAVSSPGRPSKISAANLGRRADMLTDHAAPTRHRDFRLSSLSLLFCLTGACAGTLWLNSQGELWAADELIASVERGTSLAPGVAKGWRKVAVPCSAARGGAADGAIH
jgi:serine/threonine-protein kinase